jgi:hypothetical protein
VPQFIGAVVAIGLYLFACFWVVGSLVLPALPYLLVGGAGVGVLGALGLYVAALLGAGSLGATLVTPNHVVKRLPAKRMPTAHGRDAAWPNYLFAQSRDDLRAGAGAVFGVLSGMWGGSARRVRDNAPVLLFWPLLLFPLAWMLAMTAGMATAALAAGLLLGALLAAIALVGLLAGLALRWLDGGVRRLRRARATCPHPGCGWRGTLPAFRCPCGRVHHDVRPGRQGLLRRRCACGRGVPTTVLLASAAGLEPICQDCERPLHPDAATVTDVVVPVFGPTSAGKTRLVYAGMVALSRHVAAVGGTLRAVGDGSAATLATATTIVDSGRRTTKTAADPPPAITVEITTGRRPAQLHLFDAAGEVFAHRDRAMELSYLADTEGLVFVLDPFSIPAVVSELRADRSALADAQPATEEPEQSYQVTVQWLRDRGVALGKLPLAIAVVKADLLLELHPGTGLSTDSEPADVDAWLREKALDNLLDGATRDFAEVRCFLVSSLDDITSSDGLAVRTSPARPLLWLLERSRVRVAGRREAVTP